MNTYLFIKDVKLLLRDHKFQIFIFIVFSLFIVSAVSSSVRYKSVSEDYQRRIEAQQSRFQGDHSLILQNMISSNNLIYVVAAPSPSVLFSSYDNFPLGMTNGVMFYEPSIFFGEENVEVFSINWFFILGTMMSFILLILSFESV